MRDGEEARHPMGADGDVFCLFCEAVHLSSDHEIAISVLNLLEATLKEALDGQVSPADLGALVAQLSAHMETVPQRTVADLYREIKYNGRRRQGEGISG